MARLCKRLVAVLAVAPLLVVLAACGDDDGAGGPTSSRNAMVREITDQMMADEDIGLERGEAECLAANVVDEIGFDRLKESIEEAGSLEDIEDEELSAALSTAMLSGFMDCIEDPEDFFSGD